VYGQTGGDRLSVATFAEYGEEIPFGEPGVTGAERSAAGRETVAGRWRALLPAPASPFRSPDRAGICTIREAFSQHG
jgi:hypothetical protein